MWPDYQRRIVKRSWFWKPRPLLSMCLGWMLLAGCGRSSGPIAQEQTNLACLGHMYGMYISQNKGETPKSLDDLKKFVEKKISQDRLAQLKVASANDLFVSPRDGQPFTLVSYNKLPPMKPGELPPIVLYETSGRSGQHAVAYLGGNTSTLDEAELQKSLPAKAAHH
jgi:hypothetical protein